MAGRRVYGGSEMGVFYQNEGFSSDAFEVLLSSAPAPSLSLSGFTGSRSMLNFEDVCGVGSSMNHQSFYRTTHEIDEFYDDDFDECFHQPEKKRRLTTDQVKFLEKSFEVENKVEPERKVQLAKDLGLQPRQVAIWFQNRRARWKTKQLEKDYDGLKSSYDALKSDYDKLVEEKEKLKTQVVRLTEELIVKDKHKDTTEAIFDELKDTQYNPTIHITETESQEVVGLKQEDHSSTGSTIIDSDSPRCTDGARTNCCIAFEPDQSDISRAEEDEEIKGYHDFLKLQDGSANFDFLDEDHTFLFWS